MNMRWSEEQLQAHLNAHRNKANLAKERLKTQNSAKVRQANESVLNVKIQRNRTGAEKEVLNCEIASVPPSVNHYWKVSGKRRYLSDKAQVFHAIVRVLVPALQISSRLKLDVTFHFSDNKVRDIDNYLKATIDSLVKCGFCIDDEQFDELVVKRGPLVKGGLVKIKVTEL